MSSEFERTVRYVHWPQSISELADAGVTRAMLRGRNWRSPVHGYYVPFATAPPNTAQRIVDISRLIPVTGALAGWAAGFVLGVDAMDGLDTETMQPMPVDICLGRDLGRTDPLGVRYHRDRLPAEHRLQVDRLAVTSPLRTALDGARWADDLVEAVVFLDQMAHSGLIEPAAVLDLTRGGGRLRGVGQARSAAMLADPGSANAWETRLRMFYMLQAGLPRPLVNQPLFDLTGRLLGIPDLFDPEAGLVTEFDGQDHRRRRQHRADNWREESFELGNLVVCRVDSLDFRYVVPLRERLQSRYAQGMRRDRRLDRWTLEQPLWWRRKTSR